MTATPNPIIATVPAMAFTGWTYRYFADGSIDAVHVRGGITPAFFKVTDVADHIEWERTQADSIEVAR